MSHRSARRGFTIADLAVCDQLRPDQTVAGALRSHCQVQSVLRIEQELGSQRNMRQAALKALA